MSGSRTAAAPPRVEDAALEDLRARLRSTRFVGVPGAAWERGADAGFLADLVAHWADGYDWRAAEARIAALPWVRAGGLRLLHQRAADPAAPVVVLLHGWPDSFLRFARVLPLLDDLTVVVPCLPGYPGDGSAGGASADMAGPIAAALAELGHERWTVSGGDIGAGVALALAAGHPDRVAALHLTEVPDRLADVPEADLLPEERGWRDRVAEWTRTEGGYEVEQATRPATLAVGLGDSPAGLLAWIVEKLRSWSDCGGDVESVIPRDELLTWVSLYWFSGAIGTSFAAYSEHRRLPAARLAPPAAISVFPYDLAPGPRAHAERFLDLRAWDEQPSGGHFAAWERPEAFAASLRGAVALA